jgi:hypothetical protein
MTTHTWHEMTEPLARIGTVIAYDRPAFGLTSRPVMACQACLPRCFRHLMTPHRITPAAEELGHPDDNGMPRTSGRLTLAGLASFCRKNSYFTENPRIWRGFRYSKRKDNTNRRCLSVQYVFSASVIYFRQTLPPPAQLAAGLVLR